MKKSDFITAHINSLKILIIQVFTLPLTIYRDVICRFSNTNNEEESEFKVLQWITKCYDALIVLSYTLGTVIFLLILTTVIDGGYPIWVGGAYAESRIDSYYDYEEYLESSKDIYYSKEEFYQEKERNEKRRYRKHFDEEMFFALLAILYFLPLGLSLAKEIFSIAITQVIKLGNIEKNTDT